jgi:alkanesulfonate monooxygenase SsuD/methylene tetrahydromethanopterin reductase-like flavin-dependent oxidoreductase (luciferase family)
VQLAREAATVDLLSNGRLEVGIGPGWTASAYSQSSLPLKPPGVRVDRLQATIYIIKGAWRGEPFSDLSGIET